MLCVFCSAGSESVFLQQAEAPVALGAPYNHQQSYIGFTYAPAASELYTTICVLAIASLPWTIHIQLFYNYSGVRKSFTTVDYSHTTVLQLFVCSQKRHYLGLFTYNYSTTIRVFAIASLKWTINIQVFYNYLFARNSFTTVDNSHTTILQTICVLAIASLPWTIHIQLF